MKLKEFISMSLSRSEIGLNCQITIEELIKDRTQNDA